jgi:plasmid stability protein
MATILIRDMPDEVHASLVLQAEQGRRSKEKQALYLIETGLRRKMPAQEVLARARRLHAQCKGKTAIKDILAATEEAH